jgi:hypothetical protein
MSLRTPNGPVLTITPDELTPGFLGEMFRDGVKAVVLSQDERVALLWEECIPSANRSGCKNNREVLPWHGSLTDIAKNHRSEGWAPAGRGDLLCYIPGNLGYTARKYSLSKEPLTGKIESYPAQMNSNGTTYQVPGFVRDTIWDLMNDISLSLFPKGYLPEDYEVIFERLKYDDNFSDNVSKNILLADSCGRWSRTGHIVDAYKASMVGPFNSRIVRDFLALCCVFPFLRAPIQSMNKFLLRFDKNKIVPKGKKLIGAPHTDGRYITGLLSERHNISTEFFDGKDWQTMPISTKTLTLFPGRELPDNINIKPTNHRILIETEEKHLTPEQLNVTMVIGSRKRKDFGAGKSGIFPQI